MSGRVLIVGEGDTAKSVLVALQRETGDAEGSVLTIDNKYYSTELEATTVQSASDADRLISSWTSSEFALILCARRAAQIDRLWSERAVEGAAVTIVVAPPPALSADDEYELQLATTSKGTSVEWVALEPSESEKEQRAEDAEKMGAARVLEALFPIDWPARRMKKRKADGRVASEDAASSSKEQQQQPTTVRLPLARLARTGNATIDRLLDWTEKVPDHVRAKSLIEAGFRQLTEQDVDDVIEWLYPSSCDVEEGKDAAGTGSGNKKKRPKRKKTKKKKTTTTNADVEGGEGGNQDDGADEKMKPTREARNATEGEVNEEGRTDEAMRFAADIGQLTLERRRIGRTATTSTQRVAMAEQYVLKLCGSMREDDDGGRQKKEEEEDDDDDDDSEEEEEVAD